MCPTNQQPGNLTNQKSPFPADQPIRSQEKRTNLKGGYRKKQPIDTIDTKSSFYKKQRRETHTSFDMSRKAKEQTLSLYEWKELKKNIPLFEDREPELRTMDNKVTEKIK